MKKTLLLLLFPVSLFAQIQQAVINELDYDQPSTDDSEFIEIKNTGTDPLIMSQISIDLINGTNGGNSVYLTLEDANWPAVMPGDYFVICGNAGFTTNCDADVSPDDNMIQNGAPDAIAIRLTGDTTILDRMSYEGSVPGFVETSGDSLLDPSWGGVGGFNEDKGLSRFPDGQDTDDNNVDFVVSCITPGMANTSDTTNCGLSTGVYDQISEADLFSYVIPQDGLLMFKVDQEEPGDMVLTLFDVSGKLLFSSEKRNTMSWSGGIPVHGYHNQIVLLRLQTAQNSFARRIWIP